MMNDVADSVSEPYAGAFVGAEHRFALRVYFEDTDLSGIVYHANYLRFMERARSDMLRCAGIDQRNEMDTGGGYYAVHDLSIVYRRPARLDDALLVRSRVVNVRAAACEIVQDIWRGDEKLTEGRVTAAFLGMDGRPKRQPNEWRDAFARLAANGG
jgi:acyl-CoA thioester hydrolase